jgi:hypothetical protein
MKIPNWIEKFTKRTPFHFYALTVHLQTPQKQTYNLRSKYHLILESQETGFLTETADSRCLHHIRWKCTYFREATMGEWTVWWCDTQPVKLLKPVHRASIDHYLDKIRKVSSPHIDFNAQGEWNNNRKLISWHTSLITLLPSRPASSSERNKQTTREGISVFWKKTVFQLVKKLSVFSLHEHWRGRKQATPEIR